MQYDNSDLLYSVFQKSMRPYYIDKSVLVENRPLLKFIQNYIRDSSGVFQYPH